MFPPLHCFPALLLWVHSVCSAALCPLPSIFGLLLEFSFPHKLSPFFLCSRSTPRCHRRLTPDAPDATNARRPYAMDTQSPTSLRHRCLAPDEIGNENNSRGVNRWPEWRNMIGGGTVMVGGTAAGGEIEN